MDDISEMIDTTLAKPAPLSTGETEERDSPASSTVVNPAESDEQTNNSTIPSSHTDTTQEHANMKKNMQHMAANAKTNARASGIEEAYEEIPYDKGATDLYLSVEACEWEKALNLVKNQPDQARIWIKSTGTDNTVFNWSVWRRLPIHEACRRQPPPLLISSLLAIHPQSAYLVTHFGELPIHLAVGCGACPEVVNLLIAANPNGVIDVDNGGRNAVEIMEENGTMRDDSHISRESIERCRIFLDNNRTEWEDKIMNLKTEHDTELAQTARKHEGEIMVREDDIAKLKKEVKRSKEKANDLSSQIDERERKIESKNAVERNLMEHVHKLEEEISMLRAQNRNLRNRVAELEDTVEGNEASIEKLKGNVEELSTDLVNVCATQDSIVASELRRAEQDIKRMLDSQRLFHSRIKQQKDNTRSLLCDRNITPPVPPTPMSPARNGAGHGSNAKGGFVNHQAAAASATITARSSLNLSSPHSNASASKE